MYSIHVRLHLCLARIRLNITQIEYMTVVCSIHNVVASVSLSLLGKGRVFDSQCCFSVSLLRERNEYMKVVCCIHVPMYLCFKRVKLNI